MSSVKSHKYLVTENLISARIVKEEFIRLPNCTGTVCMLTIENGFVVTGESFCVDPAHFEREIGEIVARKNAVEKIWTLEGYLAAERNYLDSLHL